MIFNSFALENGEEEEDEDENPAEKIIRDIVITDIVPIESKEIVAGEKNAFYIFAEDTLESKINGFYDIKIESLTENRRILPIPNQSELAFFDGRAEIAFVLEKAGENLVRFDLNEGLGKGKKIFQVTAESRPFYKQGGEMEDYSYVRNVLPLKEGSNYLELYIRDKFKNPIINSKIFVTATIDITNNKGIIREKYYLNNNLLNSMDKLELDLTSDSDGKIDLKLGLPEKMDFGDGIVLKFYEKNTGTYLGEQYYYGEKMLEYSENEIEQSKGRIQFHIGNNMVYIGEQEYELDVPPQIIEGRTMVPVRFISEVFGAQVEWDYADREVKIIHKGKLIVMKIDERNPEIGLDVPAVIVDGRTMVPIRYISQTFNTFVIWNSHEKRIELIKE